MSYGIIRVYDFSCDYPDGCEEHIEAQRPVLDAARAEIFRQGWRTAGDKHGHQADYCPAHATCITKTGRVLTGADLDALAAEAERGYDVSHLARAPQAQRRRVTEAIKRGHVCSKCRMCSCSRWRRRWMPWSR